jgi:hypothetical protein
MQLAMRSLVDTPNAGSWMAMTEGDEDPRECPVRCPSEPQDERHWSLRRRAIAKREIQLGATGELGPVRPDGLACAHVGECDTAPLGSAACARRDLQRLAGEPAYRLLPDCLIEARSEPARGRRHSAFAVRRAHLVRKRRELLVCRGNYAKSLIDPVHRWRRTQLQQL